MNTNEFQDIVCCNAVLYPAMKTEVSGFCHTDPELPCLSPNERQSHISYMHAHTNEM